MDRETFQENVANTIEYMVFEEGIKYVDLARKSDVAQSSLYSYKQRIGLISHDKAIRLADAMGIPLENLSRRTKKSNKDIGNSKLPNHLSSSDGSSL